MQGMVAIKVVAVKCNLCTQHYKERQRYINNCLTVKNMDSMQRDFLTNIRCYLSAANPSWFLFLFSSLLLEAAPIFSFDFYAILLK